MDEALSHPFVRKYHDPVKEPSCSEPFDFGFETTHLSKESLKAAILTEIDNFKVISTSFSRDEATLNKVGMSVGPRFKGHDARPDWRVRF